jgi:ribosome-binding protein aMBF1 (putative translation factor)
MPKRTTSDAVKILEDLFADDAEMHHLVQEEMLHSEIAREIYELRTSRGLTQQQLAEMIGTSQAAISRLENANYDGHSLNVLEKIAEALHVRLRVGFEEPAHT